MLLQCKYPCFSLTFIEKEAKGNNVNVFNNIFPSVQWFYGERGVPSVFQIHFACSIFKGYFKTGKH